MLVAVVAEPGKVELRDIAAPIPGPGQVLIEIAGCGICTLDRRLYLGEQRIYPAAAGHEPAGRVIEIGAGLAELPGAPRVGELVAIDLRTRCGRCATCRRGRTSLCMSSQRRDLPDGLISIAGGLAELVSVDARQAWPVGEVPVEHAAMGEPIACVVHSIRRSGFREGDRVAVIGGGYMGRLHLTLLKDAGARSVGIVEPSVERRAEAAEAGATWTAAPESALEVGADSEVVFVTAGGPGTFEMALELAALGGEIVLYGAFPADIAVPVGPNDIHHHETSIIGVHSHEPEDWRTAAGMIANGAFAAELDALVTARYPLAEAADAFQLASTSPVYRVIVGGI